MPCGVAVHTMASTTTSSGSAFLAEIGLPKHTKRAAFHTRVNGRAIMPNTRMRVVTQCDSTYESGFFVDKLEKPGRPVEFKFVSYTLENRIHALNFECIVSNEGELQTGTVNCFSLGTMPMDHGYLEQAMHVARAVKWDTVE